MGNLCGKQSKDNFDGPGRTLGSAPAPTTRASVPNNAAAPKPKVGGPPRTLGDSNKQDDPKAAAAAAAEVRYNISHAKIRASIVANAGIVLAMGKPCLPTNTALYPPNSQTQMLTHAQARANKSTTGDLQKKLDAQKRQTNNQTLQQAANENRLAREADQATETRNYN